MNDFDDRGKDIPDAIRQAAKERDGGRCVVCGAFGTELHHLVKRSQGGNHTLDNLATVDRRCHEYLEANIIALKGFEQEGRTVFYVYGNRRGLFPKRK